MPWQEITFALNAEQAPVFEDALMELGAMSVTLRDGADQPLLEPAPESMPLWDKVLLTAMFDEHEDLRCMNDALCSTLKLDELPPYQVSRLEDREWRRTWMDYFKPMQFGQRLWICPSGYDHPQQQGAVVIDLDPGLAFGTGSHPTTALCMQWLDGHPVKGKRVIDYGCGSGILAIAAARLGASEVYAIDNDPQALQATSDNARMNNVDNVVRVAEPGSIAGQADILIANILLEPLLSLQQSFSDLLVAGGQLVLSGLLAEQRQVIESAYSKDFTFEACEQMQDWVRLSATRNR